MVRVAALVVPPYLNRCAVTSVPCDEFGVGRSKRMLDLIFAGRRTDFVPLNYTQQQFERIVTTHPSVDVWPMVMSIHNSDEWEAHGLQMTYPVVQATTSFVLPAYDEADLLHSAVDLFKPFEPSLWLLLFAAIAGIQLLTLCYARLIGHSLSRWQLLRLALPGQLQLPATAPLPLSARLLWLVFALSIAILAVNLYQNSLLVDVIAHTGPGRLSFATLVRLIAARKLSIVDFYNYTITGQTSQARALSAAIAGNPIRQVDSYAEFAALMLSGDYVYYDQQPRARYHMYKAGLCRSSWHLLTPHDLDGSAWEAYIVNDSRGALTEMRLNEQLISVMPQLIQVREEDDRISAQLCPMRPETITAPQIVVNTSDLAGCMFLYLIGVAIAILLLLYEIVKYAVCRACYFL